MENPKRDQASPNPSEPRRPTRANGPNMWVLLATGLVLLLIWATLMTTPKRDEIPYSYALELAEQGRMAKVDFFADRAEGMFKDPLPPLPAKLSATGVPVVASGDKDKTALCKRHFQVRLKLDGKDNTTALEDQLKASKTPYEFQNDLPSQMLVSIIMTVIMVAIFIAFWLWMRRQQNQMMGGGFLSGFGKSQAKRYEGAKQAVTFADVAGIETVKAELQEIVEFLKNPEKFQKLGGRVPRGVLLNGSPGTGKTLLARAVAGEAGVPFFSVNGSEFIQMFVGVGASRVRDLFGKAKENAPAIIFIDEIDAVGRQRGAGLGGGHDEREQTLNQILGEMDGFTQTETVIVIAATNRPDVLDPALLRPGRFDRHVTVNRPTQKGRLEIFKVHVRDVPLAADVNLDTLASATIGLTGADIRNLVNEAALWAARQDKTKVDMSDFDYARDKILMGPKREEVLLPAEKKKTAYHEAGHTLLAWTLPGADRVRKVTIVPRGRALGVTHMMPSEERMSISEPELRDHLAVLLAGRAAEKLIYDEITVGAENDLERATGLARRMVMNWGMSDRLGPVSYKMAGDDPFLGKELHQQRLFSEHTLEMIDGEVARILRESSDRAGMLLVKQRQHLETLTAALLQQEELDEEEIQRLIGPSIHAGKAGNQPLVESLATSTNGQGATK